MSAETPIADELALLGLAVAEARARVAARRPVGLAEFAGRLEALCARISVGRRSEMARLAPELVKLRDELDRLALDIREMVEDLRAQVPSGKAADAPAYGGARSGAGD